VLLRQLGVIWLACVVISFAYSNTHQHKTQVARPYCIDPFASKDLGQTVYTHCSLVPMWSIKV
jgi:hypothetical protein